MSREIKFRVWIGTKDRMFKPVRLGFVDDRLLYVETDSSRIFLGSSVAETMTLMQYTGLKDKNGVEIYEGDVVSNPANHGNCEILWSSHHSCWCLGDEDDRTIDKFRLGEFWEVIGNIYENPNLVKEDRG